MIVTRAALLHDSLSIISRTSCGTHQQYLEASSSLSRHLASGTPPPLAISYLARLEFVFEPLVFVVTETGALVPLTNPTPSIAVIV